MSNGKGENYHGFGLGAPGYGLYSSAPETGVLTLL